MVLCALEKGLSSYRFCLKPLKACDQHILQFLPGCYCLWPKGGILGLSNTPDRHDKGYGHDSRVATIG
jgi:hypothetical protein